jgi:hypothetical protein
VLPVPILSSGDGVATNACFHQNDISSHLSIVIVVSQLFPFTAILNVAEAIRRIIAWHIGTKRVKGKG